MAKKPPRATPSQNPPVTMSMAEAALRTPDSSAALAYLRRNWRGVSDRDLLPALRARAATNQDAAAIVDAYDAAGWG